MGKQRNRYIILAAAAACSGVSGSIYIWSIFNAPLAEIHGWAMQDVSICYSFFLVLSTISFIAGGALQRKVHPGILAACAGIAFGAGWVIAGSAQTLPVLYLGFCVVAGLADGLGYNTAITMAQTWFPDRRGFASGVCTGAVGIVPIVFAPLGNALIEHFSVRAAFYLCAALFTAIYLVSAYQLSRPADDWVPDGWDASKGVTQSSVSDLPTRTTIRQPLFWLMWALMLIATISGLTMSAHTSDIGQDMVGMTAAQGALQISILALASFSGRLGFGWLSDRIGRMPVMFAILAFTAIDLLFIMGGVKTFVSFSIASFVVGACFGGAMSVMPALCSDVFGTTHFGQNYGVLYSGYTTAALVGPVIAARIFASTGSFSQAFIICGFVAIAGLALGVLVLFTIRRFARSQQATSE